MNLEGRRKKPADRDIQEALKLLSHHQVIQKIDGSWTDEQARLLILPSILFVLPNQKIADVYRQLNPSDDESERQEEDDDDMESESDFGDEPEQPVTDE